MGEIQTLLEGHLFIFVAAVVVIGLIVGSFLNVVIYRLPIMMEADWRRQCRELLASDTAHQANGTAEEEPFTLARPGSRCPHCGHAISALENIPLISWLLQGGKCRHCRGPISVRYPIVEALGGLLAGIVAWKLGFGSMAAAGILLTWALIALTFIDFDHQLLPDDITLPFLWIGILLSHFGWGFTDLGSSVIGAVAGYMTLWTIYQLFKFATGKEGMGYGDFKLLAMLGAWFGWQILPIVILLSSVVGAIVGIFLVLLRQHGRDIPISFGPYLAAAGWIAMLWGDELTKAYLGSVS